MASTATANPVDLRTALAAVPEPFLTRIVDGYLSIKTAFADSAFDAAGLRVGALAETLLRLLQQELTGTHTPFGQQLPPFASECLRLTNLPAANGPESLRILLPRALNFAYTLRNKRGIGHVGGDVDANQIDAATAVRIADWCICELLRLKYAVSLEEAQSIVDGISVRQLPEIWTVMGRQRVLDASLDYKSQVLLLLHAAGSTGVLVEDLREWVEHERPARFVERVINPLHNERWVEFDRETGTVFLSPTGAQRVEDVLLPRIRAAGTAGAA